MKERHGAWVIAESFTRRDEIYLNTVIICDQCLSSFFIGRFEDVGKRFRFCPRCGARMTEVRLMTKREEEAE